MKERPILFKGEMVRAIMEGRKTQTRRIIKNTDLIEIIEDGVPYYQDEYGDYHKTESACPYGKIGDRLWVRESFRLSTWDDCSCYEMCSCQIGVPMYSADFNGDKDWGPWKPSIFMPRKASRINLEITNVRVERLQDITEEDAEAEGVHREFDGSHMWYKNYQGTGMFKYPPGAILSFKSLWQSINSPESWNENPFVWVVEFKTV